MSTVDDTTFWKRFSRAIHLNEEEKAESESESSSTTTSKRSIFQKPSDTWLEQQRRKRRRCKFLCFIVSLLFISLTAGVVVLIWFAEHKMPGGDEYHVQT